MQEFSHRQRQQLLQQYMHLYAEPLFKESLISKKCLQQLEMHVIQQEQPW